MNKKSVMKILQFVFFFVGLALAIIGYVFKEIVFVYYASLMFVISNSIFSFQQIRDRIVFFIFQLTFTLFLLVKPLILIFEGDLLYKFESSIIWATATITLLATSSMSFFILIPFHFKRAKQIPMYSYSKKIVNIRFISKILFYVSYIAFLLVVYEKIIFSQSHSIFEYYENFVSTMPSIITKFADSNLIIFYIFLGTFPSKKEARFIIILHLFSSFLTLGYGVRNVLVLNFLALIIYAVIRDKFEDNKSSYWLKKEVVFSLFLLSPFIMIVLQQFDNLRRGTTTPLGALLKNFLISQGGSSEVISLSLFYSGQIPTQIVPYSFGSIYNYLTQNLITRLLFNNPYYSQNTVEMALQGHHLGSTLGYLDYPITYLSGVGMGSSFLAELFFDFSYSGVVIGTIFITMIMLNFTKKITRNPYLFGLGLVMIRWIIYTPRDTFTNWIVQGLSIMNIFAIIVIMFLSVILQSKSHYKENK